MDTFGCKYQMYAETYRGALSGGGMVRLAQHAVARPKSGHTLIMWLLRNLKFTVTPKVLWQKAKRMSEQDQPRCVYCGNFIDDCNCVCPFCGETAKCTCCIGSDKATGGG